MMRFGVDDNIDLAFDRIFGPGGIVQRDFPFSEYLDMPAFRCHAKRCGLNAVFSPAYELTRLLCI